MNLYIGSYGKERYKELLDVGRMISYWWIKQSRFKCWIIKWFKGAAKNTSIYFETYQKDKNYEKQPQPLQEQLKETVLQDAVPDEHC